MRYTFIILTILVVPVLAQAATLKVPSQYPTIQDAINAASGGDTVLVAPGTYVENIDFLGKAITVKSEYGPENTVIDGNQAGSVVIFQNNESELSILDGFTVTNGTGTDFYPYGESGGGICGPGSSPTIVNNIITGNSASSGAGIYCGSAVIMNNLITQNMAVIRGGGVLGTNPIIKNNIIKENTAGNGGGIYATYESSPIITNNTITKNHADDYGGGGGIFCNCASSLLINNIISYNSSNYGGGGISWINGDSLPGFLPDVVNCVIYGNSSDKGGGIVFDGFSFPWGGIKNTILWSDQASSGSEIWIYGSDVPIDHSDLCGGLGGVYISYGTLIWGPGMIDADPLFVDPASGDFHLTYPSPCKDTGDNTAVTALHDFEGDPRIAYGTVDMGPDEFFTHLYWTGDATPGGNVEVKFVGLPGTTPVGLCIGTGVLDPPIPSMWGDWCLQFPIIGPIDLGKIPSPDGVLVVPGTIPGSPPPPYSIPMQALIGGELTNLSVMEVN